MNLWNKYLPLLSLLLLAAIVHLVSFPGDYFVDDLLIVKNNPLVHSLHLSTIFTSDYWGVWANTGLYRPLTILSFACNSLIFGDAPVGYHLTNLLLHGLVSLLIYRLVLELQVESNVAWLAAALFAVHPMHGEAVNELVGRSELLVAIFILTGLLLSRMAIAWQGGWVSICFAGALLSKEHGIVMLALLPALDYFAGDDEFPALLRRRWRLYLCLLCITGGWLWLRSYGLARITTPPGIFDPVFVPLATLTFPVKQIVALKLQLTYLLKLVVPYHLYGMYPTDFVLPPPAPTSFIAIFVVVFSGALVVATVAGFVKKRLWGLALLCYGISCAPTANLFVQTAVTMADRLAYLPSVWFCLALAVAVQGVARRLVPSVAGTALVGAILVAYTVAGVDRGLDFRSPERLWKNDLEMNEKSELSLLFLANEMVRQERFDDAERYYRDLLAKVPHFSEGYRAYAAFLVENRKDYRQAIAMAKKSLQYAVGSPDALLPLAAAYLQLGELREALGSLDAAEHFYDFSPDYWKLRGKVLEQAGDYLAAMVCYDQERVRLGSATLDVNIRRAELASRMNNLAKAEKIMREEIEVNESAAALRKLAEILRAAQRPEEAGNILQRATVLERE